MSKPSRFQPEKEGYWASLRGDKRVPPFKDDKLDQRWLEGYDEAVEDYEFVISHCEEAEEE